MGQAISAPQFADIDYICVAADLLGKMMAELQTLEVNNRRLALAMASAGHDLRQRLHSLLIELLTSCRDDDRTAELSQRAKSVIFRFAGELEQLALQAELDFRHPIPSACRFAISPLLEQIKSDWEIEATAKHLQFVVDQADCWVESDEPLLAAILNNVVGNAVRYTSQGCVRVDSTIEGRFLILAVTDTGPGISDDDLRRSFGFSSRCRASSKGMGLGLSIARKIAETLGHQFDISTAPNSGTCVRLHVALSGQAMS